MTDTQDLRPYIREHLAKGDKSGGVKMRNGVDVVIYEVQQNGPTESSYIYGRAGVLAYRWYVNGVLVPDPYSHDGNLDLIPRPVPKRRVKGWLNVYYGGIQGGMYETRDEADTSATHDRFACIEIDCEEGEGL